MFLPVSRDKSVILNALGELVPQGLTLLIMMVNTQKMYDTCIIILERNIGVFQLHKCLISVHYMCSGPCSHGFVAIMVWR